MRQDGVDFIFAGNDDDRAVAVPFKKREEIRSRSAEKAMGRIVVGEAIVQFALASENICIGSTQNEADSGKGARVGHHERIGRKVLLLSG